MTEAMGTMGYAASGQQRSGQAMAWFANVVYP